MHFNGWYKSGVSIKLISLSKDLFLVCVKINFSFLKTDDTPRFLKISKIFLSPWIESFFNPFNVILQSFDKALYSRIITKNEIKELGFTYNEEKSAIGDLYQLNQTIQ